jgi:hypothetical protein
LNKYIVTTTINKPTEALLRFAKIDGWVLIVVGDMKTPHDYYVNLSSIIYLSPQEQDRLYPKISNMIGWNKIQRRNLGFIHAYKLGADIIATVDDDNIPLPNWGVDVEEIFLNGVEVRQYKAASPVACPLSVVSDRPIWHRGYPVSDLSGRTNIESTGAQVIRPSVLANLWNGDPDVDAICRIANQPNVEFNFDYFYNFPCNLVPFNSQNTFLAREVLPYYFMFPEIGRMDDIWGAYYLQQSGVVAAGGIIFGPASVIQVRNEHDLVRDLEQELLGYRLRGSDVASGISKFIPQTSLDAYQCYQSCFND